MATEIELKYKIPVADVQELRGKLAAYESKGRKHEQNIMFDNEQQTMHTVDARLRVRLISADRDSTEKHIELTYKRRLSVENGVKREEEIEVEFDTDASTFLTILNKMGYARTTSYERYRETFISDEVKITLDEFPYGVVLEIEGEEVAIKAVAKELELQETNLYALSCDDLYRDLCKEAGIDFKLDISFDDPEMPKY